MSLDKTDSAFIVSSLPQLPGTGCRLGPPIRSTHEIAALGKESPVCVAGLAVGSLSLVGFRRVSNKRHIGRPLLSHRSVSPSKLAYLTGALINASLALQSAMCLPRSMSKQRRVPVYDPESGKLRRLPREDLPRTSSLPCLSPLITYYEPSS